MTFSHNQDPLQNSLVYETLNQANVVLVTAMPVVSLDHVQLAMPPDRKGEARAFYEKVLQIPEAPKPPNLAKRGGCWFERGLLKIHLGVDSDFRAAKKAHPAFIVEDLADLSGRLANTGFPVRSEEPLEGYTRIYVDDPFGNHTYALSSGAMLSH